MRGTRTSGNAVALATALLLLGALTGCASPSVTIERGEMTSTARPAPPSREQPSEPDSGGGSGGGEGGGTLPGLPDSQQLEDCADLASAFFGLTAGVIGGPDTLQSAVDDLDKVRDQFPQSVQDDLDVVIDAYQVVAEQGVLEGADELTSQEFLDANTAITDFLQEQCGLTDGGSGGSGSGGSGSGSSGGTSRD
ncbi:MAG: hypothetical protein ACOYOP_11090 [Microthrixaceae bacterium]